MDLAGGWFLGKRFLENETRKSMWWRRIHFVVCALATFILSAGWAAGQNSGQSSGQSEDRKVLIRDVASVEGIRNNSLIGYGLVVGLKGTGDKQQTFFTIQTLD